MCAAEACHLGPTARQALKADCSHWPLIPVSFVINLNLQKSLLLDTGIRIRRENIEEA